MKLRQIRLSSGHLCTFEEGFAENILDICLPCGARKQIPGLLSSAMADEVSRLIRSRLPGSSITRHTKRHPESDLPEALQHHDRVIEVLLTYRGHPSAVEQILKCFGVVHSENSSTNELPTVIARGLCNEAAVGGGLCA